MKQTRNTPQRALVRDLLTDNHTHPTADEVYALARAACPSISRGTVYRNLNLLADSGEIKRITMTEGPDRYDCRIDNHYHFICRACSQVMDTQLSYNGELNDMVALPGCKTEWHRLVLVGLCPTCNHEESNR